MKVLRYCTLFGIAVSFVIIALCTPYNCGDDVYWLLNLQSDNIFRRPFDIYLNLNGRLASNLLNAILAAIPRTCWGILNAAAFTAILKLMGDFVCKTEDGKTTLYALSAIFLMRYDSVFWYCGSANYLWPALFTLLGIKLFTINPYLGKRSILATSLACAIISLTGLLLGTQHELIALSGLSLLAFFFSYHFLHRETLHLDTRTFLSLGFAIGALFSILAPGNYARAGGFSFFTPDDILFALAAKSRAMIRCLEYAPLTLIALFYVCKTIFVRTSLIISTPIKWWSIACLIMITQVTILSDGAGRTSWFCSLLSILSFFELMNARPVSIHLKKTLAALAVILAAVVLLVSCCTATMRLLNYRTATQDWTRDTNNILICQDKTLVIPFDLFDRSFRLMGDIFSEYGAIDDGRTPGFWNRHTSQPSCILLPADLAKTVRTLPQWVGQPQNGISSFKNWYHQPDEDLIACEYTGNLPHGSKILAHIEYDGERQVSLLEKFRL